MKVWLVVLAALLALAACAFVFRFFYLVYRYQFKLRYTNHWAMLWYTNLDTHIQKLSLYYGDFRRGLLGKVHEFDTAGIFVFRKADGLIYNPTAVAEYAIITYEDYCASGDTKHLNAFKTHVAWLATHASKIEPDEVAWLFHFDWFREKAPWTSGIAQGIGISALLRAYQHYGDEKYLKLAEQAFNFMHKSIAAGGKLSEKAPYDFWYEEGNHGAHVLNGHIYSLFGVWDLYRATGNTFYKTCFEKGCETIIKNIGDFDLGFFTKYDNVSPYPANNSYHYTHHVQFLGLYAITGNSFFKTYADTFLQYHTAFRHKLSNFFYLSKLTAKTKLKLK